MVFMLAPALPYIAAGVGGLGIGAALAGFFGGTGKKEAAIETGAEYHAPQEHYAPTETYAPVTTYQIEYPDYIYQIDSPFAYAKQEGKIEAALESRPYIAPTRSEYDPIGIEQKDEGTDMLKIAAVIGVAYLGGQYLEGRK